jgi:putative hydrolase of the HAD superfamily
MTDAQTTSLPIRAVILDYGEVISLPADPTVISWMAGLFRLPDDRFRYFYASFRLDYDRGVLSAAEYWGNVAHAANYELKNGELEQLRQADVTMWSRLNDAVLRWVESLRASGLKTAVLSNMHDDMVQHLSANGAWAQRFDALTLSSAIGMAKPEQDIFEYCLRSLGVSAEEAIFIDDREINVQAAQQMGIRGVFAPTSEQLRAKLEAMNFKPILEI